MAKFDLKGMLSERSAQEIDLPEQKTVYRNPEDLIPSKDNFYSTEDTEKLKQSIRALGILQPLLIEERDGKDYLLAGHRRRKCCLELIKEGLERFKRIPCVYKPSHYNSFSIYRNSFSTHSNIFDDRESELYVSFISKRSNVSVWERVTILYFINL